MRLSHLLARTAERFAGGNGTATPPPLVTPATTVHDPEIAGLTADSRAVAPGFLFAALPGTRVDGRAFIAQAVARGAVAVLASTGTEVAEKTPPFTLIEDPDPRVAFARMAAVYHAPQPDVVVAVTGTNGKTSTVRFAQQIWARLGLRAASLGTLGLLGPGIEGYGGKTTGDPVALHGDLTRAAAAGVTHLAMEASSHGLDQRRLDGVRLAASGFTNLTRDHLDYHGDMDAYFAAKARLFDPLTETGGAAVLNADVAEFAALSAVATRRGLRVIGYGRNGTEITVTAESATPHGRHLSLSVFGHPYEVELPLAGGFQAANALCALGLVLGSSGTVDRDAAVAALNHLEGIPGRLQLVGTHPSGAPILVDYAHTPDALETVLCALRPHAANRLVCVFGCGGDRDPGKRPLMGELAAELADRAIVTDDNPRTEDAALIRKAVMAGAALADGAGLEEIGDRRAAIRAAVAGLTTGDVLVVAGKGHESGQIIGTETRHFDDGEEVRAALDALAAVTGTGGERKA